MEYQNVFKRYELKYLITRQQKELLLQYMEPYMEADSYGRSTIYNIYYDTPDSILIRRSLEKPVYKEKLRVRSYGVATPDKKVFIELKKKYKGIVYKRRIAVKEEEASGYMNRGEPLPLKNQITGEIDYFCHFYRGLRPAMAISYEREAFFGKEDSGLRITLDENIMWREEKLSLCEKPHGTSILAPDEILMEIKVAGCMPLWLVRFLSAQKIYKTSFSKYGRAFLQKQEQDTVERMPECGLG
ncbi:MAG: polyphosphate polymerase domain-containing protein [Lachnospiraceae bacterium]|nr:polyphosphate polymerase domain-containing protein [Lachnospiraceae bacterium]